MKPFATTRNEDEIETTSEDSNSDTVQERFSQGDEEYIGEGKNICKLPGCLELTNKIAEKDLLIHTLQEQVRALQFENAEHLQKITQLTKELKIEHTALMIAQNSADTSILENKILDPNSSSGVQRSAKTLLRKIRNEVGNQSKYDGHTSISDQ